MNEQKRILPVWREGDAVMILDQRLLPGEVLFRAVQTPDEMIGYIKVLAVRGAPAIGIAGAYGIYLAARHAATPSRMEAAILDAVEHVGNARPTAVNLQWAVNRQLAVFRSVKASLRDQGISDQSAADLIIKALRDSADAILAEDIDLCRRIGQAGAALIQDGATILTHCNAGGLATSGYGTALAPIYVAQESGKRVHVFADETRPLLQGMRLTAWELLHNGVDVTVICDNAAASLMRKGLIDLVIVGADRIAKNGDAANKIGTYSVALAAKAHGIPFYIAAPHSTFDPSIPDGSHIPIEERPAEEVTQWKDCRLAPTSVKVINPAFDVTPASLITGIITESGILRAPYETAIADFLKGKQA